MKVNFAILTITFFLSLSVSATNGSGFVGNGGEVVASDDAIYLRDFYEYAISRPYFGSKTDQELKRRIASLSGEVFDDLSKDLLARKLTDLNALRSGLGFQVLSIIQFYDWRFTEQELGSIDNDGRVGDLPKGYAYRTAANRFITTIRISKTIWQRLDAKQQIGLIVHEAVYSILRVSCAEKNSGFCRQDAWAARELTAKFFQEISADNIGLSQALKYLVLPDRNTCTISMPMATFQLVKITSADYEPTNPKRVLLFPDRGESSQAIQKICAEFASSFAAGHSNIRIHLKMQRDPFFIRTFDYFSNIFGSQTALTVARRLPKKDLYLAYYDRRSCSKDLEQKLSDWFANNSSVDANQCCSSCEHPLNN